MAISAFTIRLCCVLVYLVLALPLPAVLLDHELGLLSGDPAHTVLDDHAWLEHAAGSGLASDDGGAVAVDSAVQLILPAQPGYESDGVLSPSVRGPPGCSFHRIPRMSSLSASNASGGVGAVSFVALT